MKFLILSIVLIFNFHKLFSQHSVVKVIINSFEGYNGYEEFALTSAEKLEFVLNSEEFKTKILEGNFIKTNGLTNQQLYDKIINGQEIQGQEGDLKIWDLRVRTLKILDEERYWLKKCDIGSKSGTIGIDGKGDGVMAICPQRLKKWASEYNYADLAGHYGHEYMHIIGFNHFKRFSTQKWRERTFVYQVGDIISNLILVTQ